MDRLELSFDQVIKNMIQIILCEGNIDNGIILDILKLIRYFLEMSDPKQQKRTIDQFEILSHTEAAFDLIRR